MSNNRRNKALVSIVFVFAILMIVSIVPLAYAVSDSESPTYSYYLEGTGGLWGDKYADANPSTGHIECYVYIWSLSCEAWGGVYGEQGSSGSYRWSVEADVELTGYIVTVGAFSGATLSIYIQLFDGSHNLIDGYRVWTRTLGADDSEDLSFGERPLSYSFSSYRSNIEYIGVQLYTVAWNGGKVCQDSTHTTISYPASIDVSEIRWESY